MSKKLLLALPILISLTAAAQTRRALLIGIDSYRLPAGAPAEAAGRGNFQMLDGCRADALAMYTLINTRYQFPAANIDTVMNADGTRDGILSAMDRLLKNCNSGDVAFLFYAGHGSVIHNSLSREAGKQDQTMVPVDFWKKGVSDIRDKELNRRFRAFLDKGVNLTVVYDCCHSGSMSRGGNSMGEAAKNRYMPGSDYDVKDATEPVELKQNTKGQFLMLSAAQPDEFASEQHDEAGHPHGAFTLALLTAIRQQSIDASSESIFVATRAILKANGKAQEPDIDASAARRQMTLFGLGKGTIPDKTLVPAMEISGNKVTLQGGLVLGINVDNELMLVNGRVKVRVVALDGINRAIAEVYEGAAQDIKPGMQFEVTNWVSSQAPFLNVYVPAQSISSQAWSGLVADVRRLREQLGTRWLADPAAQNSGVVAFYAAGRWHANVHGKTQSVSALSEIAGLSGGEMVYVNIPPPPGLADTLGRLCTSARNIRLTAQAPDAQYALAGSLGKEGRVSYALVRTELVSADSLGCMPARTAFFQMNSGIADSLYAYALRLGKIRAWINLTGAGMGDGDRYPYHLELASGNGQKKHNVKVGETDKLYLVANGDLNNINIQPRYVYVFVIDSRGQMGLVYPSTDEFMSSEKLPVNPNSSGFGTRYELSTLEMQEPAGTDTYFLLATRDRLTNAAAFFQEEVMRGERAAKGVGLEALLDIGNEVGARAAKQKLPLSWSIQRMQVKTAH